MRRVLFVSAVLVTALCASVAAADEVRLKNGDRYSGTVVQLEAGTLTFKTPHGDLKIPWNEVAALTVEGPIVLKTVDGRRAALESGAVDIAATAALSRPEPQLVITGGAGAGFLDTGGNTDVRSLRTDGDVVVRRRANRYTAAGAVNRASNLNIETARSWTVSARYDRFLTPRLFLNAHTILTNDEFRDLDLRTAVGGGLGYQVADTPLIKFSVEGGLGFVNENFQSTPDDSYTALREATKLDVLLTGKRMVLFHAHDGYFGVTGDDNLFIKMQNGIRLSLVGGFVTTAQMDLDYDRSPAPGRRNSDRTFALTFGYRF
jgi:putative salt-induced outer membrane protein YdiY